MVSTAISPSRPRSRFLPFNSLSKRDRGPSPTSLTNTSRLHVSSRQIFNAFCARKALQPDAVRFLFDGTRINATQTPADVRDATLPSASLPPSHSHALSSAREISKSATLGCQAGNTLFLEEVSVSGYTTSRSRRPKAPSSEKPPELGRGSSKQIVHKRLHGFSVSVCSVL